MPGSCDATEARREPRVEPQTLLISPAPSGGGEFFVGEIERHARIVAPSGARVQAVPAGARDWMATGSR